MAGLEDSRGGAREGAVAGVADAVGSLYGEESLALQGEIEWVAGDSELALAEIEPIAAEDAEAVYRLAYLRGGGEVLVESSGEHSAEVVALGAKAVGACVRQIVGGRVECLRAREQGGICRVESAVHAQAYAVGWPK